MRIKKILLLTALALSAGYRVTAQDTTGTDLLADLEKETASKEAEATKYTTATFKTTRLISGHSSENVAKGVMDVKIAHRFGTLNKGAYELFGLDNATMRMGVDYGITKNLMVGIGRSTYQKTYDAFFKIKLLRQSTGRRNMPISLSYVPTIALKTLKDQNTEQKNYFSSRLYYTHQLIIARKFSDKLSLQLMPTFVHRNLVSLASEPNDILAIGFGGRQKLTRRLSLNAEYYYLLPGSKLNGTTNSLSIGFDIETGGHVFQLHFTNSQGMNERTFISETTGKWEKGDILFGFNISRVFTIGKNR
jgi:Membrane bound beta barrel domain (DUF5777)